MRIPLILMLMLLAGGCNDSGFTGRSDKGRTASSKDAGADFEGADDGSTSRESGEGADGAGGIKVDPESDNGAAVQATDLKLGLNFEDRGLLGDRDYNDDVLCFEGKFEVTKATGTIKSLIDQDVIASLHRNAKCAQRITISIRHPDGTENVIVREPAHKKLMAETLTFKSQSTLDVTFQALDKSCDMKVHRVTEPDFVMFSFDVCNLKGKP